MDGSLFLGIDLGTQSLKLCVIDWPGTVVREETVPFSSDAVCFGPPGSGEVRCRPSHWVTAIEEGLDRLGPVLLGRVVAISGGAQQHGTIYWRRGSNDFLRKHFVDLVDIHENGHIRSMVEILNDGNVWTIPECPIWMDTSPGVDLVRGLEKAVGNLAQLTGSSAQARFGGLQMAQISRNHPEKWKETDRVSLVSSFVASLFIGRYAPIDVGDGSGMNLLDVHSRTWSQVCADFVDPSCVGKLGPLVSGSSTIGQICPFMSKRFAFSPTCLVGAFSGDNLNVVAGQRLVSGDSLAISLGTSDTLFGIVKDSSGASLDGHLFISALADNEYVRLVCFSNGSLARERIRDDFANGSWVEFNSALKSIPAGSNGLMMIEYSIPELCPQSPAKRRFSCPPQSDAHVCKAMIEGQALRLLLYARKIGLTPVERLIVSGGAAQNTAILQVISSVFGLPIYSSPSASAAYGGALRAIALHSQVDFVDAVKHVPNTLEMICVPDMEEHNTIYKSLVENFMEFCSASE